MIPRQPYPGLRAFDRDEADLFFGREGCIDSMVDRLAATRFLAVLGSSGSGKSSLVRTGLLDALELGLLGEAGSRWAVAAMRPGGAPLANLAHALLAAVGSDGEAPAVMLEAFLRRGPLSLAEWCRDGHLPPGSNLLVLADQFEELFRYGDYAAREEAQAFVALLLEATRQRDVPIHVVLTMRSEFLGACALVPGLAERINAGLYLTPRMTRQETREAIEGPAAVCGFAIETGLVTRLLNDLAAFAPWDGDHGTDQLQALSRRADQLPLMQHVLNRLWLRASGAGGPITLRLADYDDLGGLGGAIDAHAQEILDTLGPAALPLVEPVFRALVTGTSVATALRRPCRFTDIVSLCDAPREAVAQVVEAFRAAGCNFLMPPPDVPLADGTIVDISHESLIRQWSRLSAWLEREVDAGAAWRRLAAAAQAHAAGRGELLSGRDLGNVESFWSEQSPTEAWARRHGGGFAAATDYLAQSRRAAAERERADRERQDALRARDRREKRRLRAGAVILLVLFLASGLIAERAVRSEKELQLAIIELETVNTALDNYAGRLGQSNYDLARREDDLKETLKNLRTTQEASEHARKTATNVVRDVVEVLGDTRHYALVGGEDLFRDLNRALAPHFQSVRELSQTADVMHAETEARLIFARLTRQTSSASEALPLFAEIHASLSALAARRALTDTETFQLVRATVQYANLQGALGYADRKAVLLAELEPHLPAMDAPLEGLSAQILDAYAWYLGSKQDMVPWEEATQWRSGIRERYLDVARQHRAIRAPVEAEYVGYAASSLYFTYRNMGHLEDARAMRALTLESFRANFELAPRSQIHVSDYAYALANAAEDALGERKFDDALRHATDAVEVLRAPLAMSPNAARMINTGAFVYDTHASVLRARGDAQGAIARNLDSIDLVLRQLRADPQNVSVANDTFSRLSGLVTSLEGINDPAQTRARCLTVAADVLSIATRYSGSHSLQTLVAVALECAMNAQSTLDRGASEAAIVQGPDRDRLDALIEAHTDYLIASFRDRSRRIDQDFEFHARMGRAVEYRYLLAERRGDAEASARFAAVLIEALNSRRPELDYDRYAMQRLAGAHLHLATLKARQGDVRGQAEHLDICADPEQVPHPDRRCMEQLAGIIERGALGSEQLDRARTLRERLPHYQVKRFTIPVPEWPGGPTVSFNVYIPPPLGFEGIDDQVLWLRRSRGFEVPADVVDRFRNLHRTAKASNVSFPDLAVYELAQGYTKPRDALAAAAQPRPPDVSIDRAGLAIGGYDVVAYFTENRARAGTTEHFVVHQGSLWFFANAQNAAAFRAEPARYLPQFGGFCAGCLYSGHKVNGDPQHFAVIEGTLTLHSSAGLAQAWRTRAAELTPTARAQWARRAMDVIAPAPDTDHTRSLAPPAPR